MVFHEYLVQLLPFFFGVCITTEAMRDGVTVHPGRMHEDSILHMCSYIYIACTIQQYFYL